MYASQEVSQPVLIEQMKETLSEWVLPDVISMIRASFEEIIIHTLKNLAAVFKGQS